MSMRMHSVTKVAEYGSSVANYELSNKILDVFYNADDSWVSEDEQDGEISREELQEIIPTIKDTKLKQALQTLLDESDKNYEMVKFAIF